MESYATSAPPIDPRFASWLSSSPPPTVGYHLRFGVSPPEPSGRPYGTGPGWEGRAIAAVLRGCYRRGLRRPALEEVEAVAISILPMPAEEEDQARPPFRPSPVERWENAVSMVSGAAHRVMCHGPASGAAGGEVVYRGGLLASEACGLEVEQRVDLIWRRPDGKLEAVLVIEEPWKGVEPPRPEDDWRCVLAAAVVSELYAENPDLHTVWAARGVARVCALPPGIVEEKLCSLRDILDGAQDFDGLSPAGDPVHYSFSARPPGISEDGYNRDPDPPLRGRPDRRGLG